MLCLFFFLYHSHIPVTVKEDSLMRLFKDGLVVYFFPHLETQEGNFCAEDFRKLAELL